jgi:hypothetical protein
MHGTNLCNGQRLSADFGPPSLSSAAGIFFPPGNSITRADAVVGFDFALKPSTVIWSPTLRVSRDHPFCASSLGLAAFQGPGSISVGFGGAHLNDHMRVAPINPSDFALKAHGRSGIEFSGERLMG